MADEKLTPEQEAKRKFLKYAAIGVVGVAGAAIGLGALYRALYPPRVIIEPPVTTTNTTTTKTTTTVSGPRNKAEMQELFLRDNPTAKQYPFATEALMGITDVFLIGSLAKGDYSVYDQKTRQEVINRLWNTAYEQNKKGERMLSLEPEKTPFSNREVQLRNLMQSFLNNTISSQDPETGKYAFSNPSPEFSEYRNHLARVIDKQPKINESARAILDDDDLYQRSFDDYAIKWTAVRYGKSQSKENWVYQPFSDLALSVFDWIKENGTKYEKDQIALRGYDVTRLGHDEGRSATMAKLWSLGSPGYDGTATVPFVNREGGFQIVNDGYTPFSFSDNTALHWPNLFYNNKVQTWGFWQGTEGLVKNTVLRGEKIKLIASDTPPNYLLDSLLYKL